MLSQIFDDLLALRIRSSEMLIGGNHDALLLVDRFHLLAYPPTIMETTTIQISLGGEVWDRRPCSAEWAQASLRVIAMVAAPSVTTTYATVTASAPSGDSTGSKAMLDAPAS